MKAYSIHWKDETLTPQFDNGKPERGTTIVVADAIEKAIDHFNRTAGDKIIDSVYLESETVLIRPS
jgi:hypothetical protein